MNGSSTSDPVFVLGIGADGWDGLTEAHQAMLRSAQAVVGGQRHLDLLPEITGQFRLLWPSPLRPNLVPLFEELRGRFVVVLASGDPLVSGIGSTLIELLGVDRVRILPAVSSVALARARMGWSDESVTVVSSVGRDPAAVLRVVTPAARLLVLSADETTPATVAALLTEAGYGGSRLIVLGDLGGLAETLRSGTAVHWTGGSPRLNVLAVECVADDGTVVLPTVPGLPDSAYESDGQLTKREARAAALAHLAPVPGQLLWDVGAGAGSVAIEWCRADPRCRAVALERDPVRANRIVNNARRLGVPGLQVVIGSAPAALADLPSPHAVFIGGGATIDGVVDTCWDALLPGGRLIVHGVTLETETLLFQQFRSRGGELVRLSVERAEPIGSFTGWKPLRPITQWSVTK